MNEQEGSKRGQETIKIKQKTNIETETHELDQHKDKWLCFHCFEISYDLCIACVEVQSLKMNSYGS